MTAAAYDVAIVGAGPTGLTLTNILGAAGCRVVLIERNATTVQEPRAVSIDDESLRTMQAIGLAEAVIRNVALDYGSHYFTASGRCFLKVEPTTREYGFPRRNAFSQPILEATLRAGLDRYPNVAQLFRHECETISQNADSVSLSLRAPDEQAVEISATYLAGCDGGRSMVRKVIGATFSGSTYDQRWLIVDLGATVERLRQTRVVCNPSRPLITLPGPGGIRRYEFLLHDGETDEQAVLEDFVRDLLAAHGPDAAAPIARKQVYTFHARVADCWSRGRILLAGDAAHLSPPFAGQGMNSGIRDAHNLGWKLAAVVNGRFGPQLLDSYETERAPHAHSLIKLAVDIGRVMMPTSRLSARLMQTGFRLMRIAPSVQTYFAQMKYKPKPFYAHGFVARHDDGLDIVGRMLPQPEVEMRDRRRTMLDELLGSGFALIAYGPDAERVIAAASELDLGITPDVALAILPSHYNPGPEMAVAPVVLRDVTDALVPISRGAATIVLLVRPDRYVAIASSTAPSQLAEFATDCRRLDAATRLPHTLS